MTVTDVHPTAVVDASAELEEGVSVGPYAVIGPGVVIGAGTEIGAGAQVRGPATRIGRENRIFAHACIGFEPQDLKFRGEETRLEIGDRNHFREFATVHRGTAFGGGATTIGSDNLFMVYTHVAHDCAVGDRCILVNNATLGGHVGVHDDATIGAFTAVHQFTRVGRHAYVGGFTVLTMDALPYVKTVGQKPSCYGVNAVGLKRKGVPELERRRIGEAMKLLLSSGLNTSQALDRIRSELGGNPEIDYLIEFVEGSERGVVKAAPGRRGDRGGGEGERGG
ncbi:MAG TPA: acyl-ACP--UDP-N-acetylglucosamine O-acyltransferase [Thermoanaerobaculia bacterium]|nr:acyl-ACP--UDP-N-acetylglucosamine O-acyltransferase [Thermoanaerobaculia bacterium]